MTTKDHEVIDRNGKRVRRDVLEDGDRTIVRMTMMDAAASPLVASLEPHQRETYIDAIVHGTPLADALAKAKAVKRVEQFDASKHRPGYAGVRDAAQTDAISKALDERDARLTTAWKKPPSVTVDGTTITPVEKVAVVGPAAGNETLFAARDRVVADRDKRTSEAWRS